jgi:hypothetical protein
MFSPNQEPYSPLPTSLQPWPSQQRSSLAQWKEFFSSDEHVSKASDRPYVETVVTLEGGVTGKPPGAPDGHGEFMHDFMAGPNGCINSATKIVGKFCAGENLERLRTQHKGDNAARNALVDQRYFDESGRARLRDRARPMTAFELYEALRHLVSALSDTLWNLQPCKLTLHVCRLMKRLDYIWNPSIQRRDLIHCSQGCIIGS